MVCNGFFITKVVNTLFAEKIVVFHFPGMIVGKPLDIQKKCKKSCTKLGRAHWFETQAGENN